MTATAPAAGRRAAIIQADQGRAEQDLADGVPKADRVKDAARILVRSTDKAVLRNRSRCRRCR
ncbi:MAG TPA: hypothetical protein VGO59_11315 [Verrucomicrobiae bacterium]